MLQQYSIFTVSVLCSAVPRPDVKGVDYLQSVYDHMKGLTALVTEWEGKLQGMYNVTDGLGVRVGRKVARYVQCN